MNKKYYFVYGTLKQGHGNHRVLKDSKKVGEFTTEPVYTMFSLGGFPGVIKGGNTAIKGEIYEVISPEIENGLDRLEGYQKNSTSNLYNKEIIKLGNYNAYIYTFNSDRRNINNYKKIESGKW